MSTKYLKGGKQKDAHTLISNLQFLTSQLSQKRQADDFNTSTKLVGSSGGTVEAKFYLS